MGICGQSKLINELYFEVVIPSEDVNKKIYFIDNSENFTEPITKKKHNHDFLPEVNERNTQLYINYKKTKFQKFFIPDQKGIYRFQLKFDIELSDCSYMFYNCKNLLRVDFTKFKTNYLSDVKYMFYCCSNLIDINFTFFDTYTVTDMSFMFYFCIHLEKLDIGIFSTENVTNMKGMFSLCQRLTELNLSNFNTKNVRNMEIMFEGCCNLKNLDLSSFNFDKVEEYSNIFDGCKFYSTFKLDKNFAKKIGEVNTFNTFYC